MTMTVRGYSATSERSRGWLRYLYRKATTPDSWDKEDQPHPHWDNISDAPRRSWHRFDLLESSYAMGLMADTTPAWREVYGRILDELAYRYNRLLGGQGLARSDWRRPAARAVPGGMALP